MQTYTVRSGDLIDSIARRFGITRQALLDLNPTLTGPYAIHVGQILRVDPAVNGSSTVEFTLGVDATGRVTRRSEYRLESRRESVGHYVVTFPVEVHGWTWLATVVSDPGRDAAPAVITVASAPGDPTSLSVTVVALTGDPVDSAFHLRVSRP